MSLSDFLHIFEKISHTLLSQTQLFYHQLSKFLAPIQFGKEKEERHKYISKSMHSN